MVLEALSSHAENGKWSRNMIPETWAQLFHSTWAWKVDWSQFQLKPAQLLHHQADFHGQVFLESLNSGMVILKKIKITNSNTNIMSKNSL